MKQTNQTMLITGFEPFGGERVNPSWEAVRFLPGRIGHFDLQRLLVPTAFGLAGKTVLAEAERINPDIILCVGQAAGRAAVTPEQAAINLRWAKAPDNAGLKPLDQPVIAGGPAAFFSTLPVRKMAEAIQSAGLPGEVSYSAGTFVCNDLLYTLLFRFQNTNVRAGFIHVPMLPEQAKGEGPSLPLEKITAALEAAILSL